MPEEPPLMQEEAPLISTEQAASRPSSRRRAALALASISAIALTARHSTVARQHALLREAAAATDEDGLYVCYNGVPSVPTEYSDGSWGNIDGDWYAIAGNLNGHASNIGDCSRFRFALKGTDNRSMTQNMIYYNDDNDGGSTWFYWNFSHWKTDDVDEPYWKSSDDDKYGVGYKGWWATVAAVGTYEGSRWWVFYLCGKAVTVTDRGQYFVLYEQYEYDDGFIETTKKAVIDAGLTKGNYTEYTQRSNCLYNWHHIAVENGNEWEDDHH